LLAFIPNRLSWETSDLLGAIAKCATEHVSSPTAWHAVQTPSSPLIMSVTIIAAGTALAGYGELNASIIGMLIQLVSESAEAARLIMTQTLLQGMSFHPMEGLMYLAPASIIWMVIGAAMMEFQEIADKNALLIVKNNPGLFLAAATMGFGVMTLALFTIQLCGSLTLKVGPRQS
jgi:hypothetical protein